jgi:hypothetical protein
MRRFLRSTAQWLAFLFLCTLALPFANAKELRIEKFDAQIAVLPDSSINVTEAITAHFIGGPWHGLYREIPVEFVTTQGMNYSLFLKITRIVDGSGHDLKYESSRERHYLKLKIYVPNPDNSLQTINILEHHRRRMDSSHQLGVGEHFASRRSKKHSRQCLYRTLPIARQ